MTKLFYMICLFLKKGGYERAKFLKKHNIFINMGENCYYHPRTIPSEPFLVSFHDNVVVAADVSFITHDITCGMFNNATKYKNDYEGEYKVKYGTIEIMDNVFIGAKSVILPNIKIGADVIIVAGRIITKDVPSGSIVGGDPAKVIGKTGDYANKMKKYSEMYSEVFTQESMAEYFKKK